jgi:ATP-dependent DNA helicase PIF1
MDKLHGPRYTYHAIDGGTMKQSPERTTILNNFSAPRKVVFCQGALVMLNKNLDDVLVNGKMGHIVGFEKSLLQNQFSHFSHYPIVEFVLPSGLREHIHAGPALWSLCNDQDEILVSRLQV